MGILNYFKNKDTSFGEDVADYLVSLGGDDDFRKLLFSIKKPMSIRILINDLFVNAGAGTYFLFLKYKIARQDSSAAYSAMIKRFIWHLEKMAEEKIAYNIGDIIVSDIEMSMFLRDGWKMNELTTVYTVFSVIGDHRVGEYSRAVGNGYIKAVEGKEGADFTAELLQSIKKYCGSDVPYINLRAIYANRLMKIFKYISK